MCERAGGDSLTQERERVRGGGVLSALPRVRACMPAGVLTSARCKRAGQRAAFSAPSPLAPHHRSPAPSRPRPRRLRSSQQACRSPCPRARVASPSPGVSYETKVMKERRGESTIPIRAQHEWKEVNHCVIVAEAGACRAVGQVVQVAQVTHDEERLHPNDEEYPNETADHLKDGRELRIWSQLWKKNRTCTERNRTHHRMAACARGAPRCPSPCAWPLCPHRTQS